MGKTDQQTDKAIEEKQHRQTERVLLTTGMEWQSGCANKVILPAWGRHEGRAWRRRNSPLEEAWGYGVCAPCGHPALGWAINLPKPWNKPWAGWKRSTQCCEQASITWASSLRPSLQGQSLTGFGRVTKSEGLYFFCGSPQHIPKEPGFTSKRTKQTPIALTGKRHLFLETPRFHADINDELICSGDQYSKQLFPAGCTPTISQWLPLLNILKCIHIGRFHNHQ